MLTRSQVAELSRIQIQPAAGQILSFYLQLDKQHPDDRPTHRAKSVLRPIEAQAVRLDPAGGCGLRRDVARVRDCVADRADSTAAGLAVFACEAAALWRAYELRGPVENRAAVGPRPYLRPLVRLLGDVADDYVTVLVGRDRGRIFEARQGELTELRPEVVVDVPGQHAQGGWSQANYRRHIEERVRAHYQSLADRLFARFQEGAFPRLILAGPDEVVHAFAPHLHRYLAELVVGTVHLPMEAGVNEVRAASRGVLRAAAAAERGRLLDQLAGGRGDEAMAVTGLEATVEALQGGQVLTLLIDGTLVLPGARCARCGFCSRFCSATDDGAAVCPYCLTPMEPSDDITDAVVEQAFAQEARIVHLGGQDERARLAELGGGVGLGALLRFATGPDAHR